MIRVREKKKKKSISSFVKGCQWQRREDKNGFTLTLSLINMKDQRYLFHPFPLSLTITHKLKRLVTQTVSTTVSFNDPVVTRLGGGVSCLKVLYIFLCTVIIVDGPLFVNTCYHILTLIEQPLRTPSIAKPYVSDFHKVLFQWPGLVPGR